MTFVFTDIEGSTDRAVALGDARWAEMLDVHDRLVREAVEDGGRVVNTEGDAFFVVYRDPVEAVSGAVAVQRSLVGHAWDDEWPLRVRIGVHTGTALVRNGDYVGAEVHRAARICDAGHGGQIVVSDATARLVHDALSGSMELVDLGLHRLKDLTAPQQLFSVAADDLPSEFPPLRSLDAYSNNLPVQRSSLIGRTEEIAETRALLGRHRLVTLTGIGGTGKTRLALQAASEELERHPDGVFFVDLAPVVDADVVAHTAAEAVGLQLGGPRPPHQQLVEWLRRRRCLLVLDNSEHLLDACADLVDEVLGAAPGVEVLATSREPLGLEGEHVYRVPSLPLPAPGSDRSALAGSDAVDLFVERARSVDAAFDLTDDNAAAVAQIVRRVDGIPLAIEFAAARVSHLAPDDIAERLDGHFQLLTGGRRRARRQQTLEAALDWSFDLLDEAHRQLLRRLGVFSASFDLSMAERVCVGGAVSQADVLDLLGSLVDKSLVLTEKDQGRVRYRLLETVRSYAEQKLHDAGEAEQYRSRHRDAYLHWLESRPWEDPYIDGTLWNAIVAEHDNLRAALQWCREDGRRDLAGRIAARAHPLWQPYEGHGAEGARWLDWALEAGVDLPPDVRSACLLARANAALTLIEDWEAYAEAAAETGTGDVDGPVVFALGMQAIGAATRSVATGDPDAAAIARGVADEGMRRAQDIGEDWTAIMSQFHGQTIALLGDLPAAERSLTKAAGGRMAPSLYDGVRAELSMFRFLLGDSDGSYDAVTLTSADPAAGSRPFPYVQLAASLAAAGVDHLAEATEKLDVAISMIESRGVFLETNAAMTFAAALALELGQPLDAASLLEAAMTVGDAREVATPFRAPAVFLLFVHTREQLRTTLDGAQARRCRQRARTWTSEEAWAAVHAVRDALAHAAAHVRATR